MIRTGRFLISQRPYAVDMSSLIVGEPTGQGSVHAWVSAVWFRRRKGVLAACAGRLWDIQSPPPADAGAFLAAHKDGRYGGDCRARWDGSRLWSADQEPVIAGAYLDLLRPMLEGYPDTPDGFEGWYHF